MEKTLKNIRKQKYRFSKDAAEALNISKFYYSKLENRKVMPSRTLLIRISNVFNIDIETTFNLFV